MLSFSSKPDFLLSPPLDGQQNHRMSSKARKKELEAIASEGAKGSKSRVPQEGRVLRPRKKKATAAEPEAGRKRNRPQRNSNPAKVSKRTNGDSPSAEKSKTDRSKKVKGRRKRKSSDDDEEAEEKEEAEEEELHEMDYILEERKKGGSMQYLVRWLDGVEDSWVDGKGKNYNRVLICNKINELSHRHQRYCSSTRVERLDTCRGRISNPRRRIGEKGQPTC